MACEKTPTTDDGSQGLVKKLWIKGEPVGKINRIVHKQIEKNNAKNV